MTLAIDLCAGIGWSVACERLGISELGIEIMDEAVATRTSMGMLTQQVSIADLPDTYCAQAPIQIAGPPCQTFSAAGNGEGRRMLDEVLRRVSVFATTGTLIKGGEGDPRTWLVLEPLRLAVGGMPMYIVWEQVPSVLPVWESCARVLDTAGYSTWTGILHSEQYGVPQTRKRAFLMARRDGIPAGPPVPTHSKYHHRTPEQLDSGVLPWVSMATALGWGVTGRPSFTITGGGSSTGGADPYGRAARESLMDELLAYRNGSHEKAAVRDEVYPAPTVMFGARSNDVRWVQRSNYTGRGVRSVPSPVPGSPPLGAREMSEPSATVTGKGHHWAIAPTASSIRVTVEEAAILQTFPRPDLIQGSQGKRYLQVGNMVPPLLGEAILSMFLEPK